MSEVIQQEELKNQLKRKASLAKLRSKVRELEAKCSEKDSEIIARINSGARIREGQLTAGVKEGTRKNRISENRVKEILGEESLKEIKENLGESPYRSLEIFESITDLN